MNLFSRIVLSGAFIAAVACTSLFAQTEPVTIIDRGNYFEVTLDYSAVANNYEMGEALMQKIKQAQPQFEALVDSYIAGLAGNQMVYNMILSRVDEFGQLLPQEYVDEIDGMINNLSPNAPETMGDGLLSPREFYGVQLLPDIGRTTQCSAFSVYGARAENADVMTARVLDWTDGVNHELTKIQAVMIIKNGTKSICSIGYMGMMGILTGFNDDGVFAGILDAGTGAAYSPINKRSYPFDLRYALENNTDLAGVAAYMTNEQHDYAYNHLITLADKQSAGILENNISGSGTSMHRAVRNEFSILNSQVLWDVPDAVAAVNCFMLNGNHNNYTGSASNMARWTSLREELGELTGTALGFWDLRVIAGFDNDDGPDAQSTGDLYNDYTQQIVIFRPRDLALDVAFKPKTGVLPEDPIWDIVSVDFNTGTDVENAAQSLPEQAVLYPNYPNPFRGATAITYALPEAGYVTLKVYNALGGEVASLTGSHTAAGKHIAKWNSAGLPAGVYYCRLTTGNTTLTQTMVVK